LVGKGANDGGSVDVGFGDDTPYSSIPCDLRAIFHCRRERYGHEYHLYGS
jgi:hypothetical protein